jgi:AP-4 complex subunit mu-1
MIGQFFILSPRGDTIISKDFRGDAIANLHDIFFRKVKFWDKSDAPPVFQIEDINFIYIKRNSLLIVCTTRFNVSPSSTIELLNRMAKVFKDYCGILTEESIRKNFILVYELLDEILDYGYPQITSTEVLKSCVHNEAVLVNSSSALSKASSMLSNMSNRTKSSMSSNIPITMKSTKGSNKNEIYVDIVERLTLLFNASGYVVNSSIDGSILMKSFLSGNPELRLALNEDLVIGKGTNNYGSVVLDDCNFHECVHLDEFENSRMLHFLPPDGEFSVLNYRITADFKVPFKIFPSLEEPGPYKIDALAIIRADIPEGNHGSNVIIRMPVPRGTVGCTAEFNSTGDVPGCTAEYNSVEKVVVWKIRKFLGGSEICLRAKITLDQQVTAAFKKEIGPIAMSFEIPMHNVSNLQVRYLRISETHKSYNPCRWVRYITQSSSYVCRF